MPLYPTIIANRSRQRSGLCRSPSVGSVIPDRQKIFRFLVRLVNKHATAKKHLGVKEGASTTWQTWQQDYGMMPKQEHLANNDWQELSTNTDARKATHGTEGLKVGRAESLSDQKRQIISPPSNHGAIQENRSGASDRDRLRNGERMDG